MLPSILQRVADAGFRVFDGGHAFNLNIVAIRNSQRKQDLDVFDDMITCTYRQEQNGRWITKSWQCTTDPGLIALLDPTRFNTSDGTAIVKAPQQMRGAYELGLHRKRYEALVQRKPITIYRDNDRDKVLDMDPDSEYTGLFGCNIHKAGHNSSRISGDTYTWSAGCIVFKRAQDFNELIDLAHLQLEHHPNWAKAFTLTLLEDE
jgi:hypothetical protein